MVRYLLTAASALAIMSGVTLAHAESYSTKSVTVTRSAPHATVYSRPHVRAYVTQSPRHKAKMTKRYINSRGKLVTKTKTFRDGFSGSSVSRTKTVTDPVTGMTRSRTVIER